MEYTSIPDYNDGSFNLYQNELGKENICPNINVALEKAKAIIEK
jgi:hypothetical protein